MNISRGAFRFTRAMQRHGVEVRRSASSISESVYLTCSFGEKALRVRASNHVARPTYELLNGRADLEFGDHDMSAGDDAAAVLAALRLLSIAPDARAIALPRRAAAIAAATDRALRARVDAAWAPRLAAEAAYEAIFWREMKARYPTYEARALDHSKSSKNKRRLLRRKLEAELAAEGISK